MKLTNAILGRGKGHWHLDGLGENNKPVSICLKPIRELLQYCSDDTLVYDAKDAEPNQFIIWCLSGPIFSPIVKKNEYPTTSARNRNDFLSSLKSIKGVKFGIVKNHKIFQVNYLHLKAEVSY